MSAFTPGPWKVENNTDVFSKLGGENSEGLNADHNDGWQIADCNVGGAFVDHILVMHSFAEQKANARLIASAPDLLAALKWIDTFAFDAPEIRTKARMAIAKATGEQS